MNERQVEVLNLGKDHRRGLITDDEFLFRVKGIYIRYAQAQANEEQQEVWDSAVWNAEQGVGFDRNFMTMQLLNMLNSKKE